MTPRQLLRSTADEFRRAGIPDPETDGALLLSALCGRPPLSLRLDDDTVLEDEILRRFSAYAARRVSREPLQYILGETYFCGRSFLVDRRVLIPRPETELLCGWALERITPVSSPSVLDLCCGSGCIGLTLSAERPDLSLTLSDISPDALAVASMNADRLSLSPVIHQGDLGAGLPPRSFDLVISNPPYIPSGECSALQPEVRFEPLTALSGGEDGLRFYRRIAAEIPQLLKPGGMIMMELGIHEAEAVSEFLSRAGFSAAEIRRDLRGIERMILAVLPHGGTDV